ncbi:MAG: hypothetical protein K2Z81_03515 [Cyanobacteria bacterium]|nr:hypothetical protein [Cyanobacteriota bacterium]
MKRMYQTNGFLHRSTEGFSLLLLLCLVSSQQQVSAAATADWRKDSREAYSLYRNREKELALKAYEQAVKKLGTSANERVIACDLQLNIIHILVELKRFDQALAGLNQVRSELSRITPSKTLLMRYWHRARFFHQSTRDFQSALADQRHILKLSIACFGEQSCVSLTERKIMMSIFLDLNEGTEAAKIAVYLSNLARDKEAPEFLKRDCKQWIKVDFQSRSKSIVSKYLDRGHLRQAYALLQAREELSSDAPVDDLQEWFALRIAAFKKKSPDQASIKKAFLSLLEKRSDTELKDFLPDLVALLFGTKVYDGIFDTEAEYVAERAYTLANQTYSPAEANKVVPSIHARVLFGWILARRGKLRQAEKIIDSIQPDPETFTTSYITDGLFQARVDGLASEFLKQNDRVGVERQFQKLAGTLSRLVRVPNRADILSAWKTREEELCGKLSIKPGQIR